MILWKIKNNADIIQRYFLLKKSSKNWVIMLKV